MQLAAEGIGEMRTYIRTRLVVERASFHPQIPAYASTETVDQLAMDKARFDGSIRWEEESSEVQSVEEINVTKDPNN